MNREDLFKLVKDWADEVTDGNGYVTYEFDPPALVRFVECVIEEEREACAKLCEAFSVDRGMIDDETLKTGVLSGASMCALAIRAKGQG